MGSVIMEEYGDCKCGYGYEFVTGYTAETFGKFRVEYGYNFNKYRMVIVNLKITLLCKLWKLYTFEGLI